MQFLNLFLIAACVAVNAQDTLYTEDKSMLKTMWSDYKLKWAKSYSTTEEEALRFNIFVDNLQVVDERNARELEMGGNAVHGLTRFSDLTQNEFRNFYLTNITTDFAVADPVEITTPVDEAATLKDWSGVLTTPIKDQAQCGSCWAFSAVEQIESDAIRELGVTYKLSAQQVTSCTSGCSCNGGYSESAYNYVKSAGGIEQETDYPYTSGKGVTGTCQANSKKAVISITGYKTVTGGESAMASYVQNTGPLSICLDAETWNSYKSGIMTVCATKPIDHCVQAVGIDTGNGYWKVRNSWGTSWGEQGYIRIQYGKNLCGLTNDPTYATGLKKLA